ncbi:MAG: phosphatidate cytidylyltransferase, partial [Candidatus Nanopelagicales bacterium]|nr:phosphatidate cytidylyltransferase [Candidatus Nanopelagicales bacterium]
MGSPEAAPVEPPKSRAGRNLPVAIAVGVGLGALIIATLAFYKYLFAVLVTAAILVAVWELYNAFLHNDIKLARSPLYIVA